MQFFVNSFFPLKVMDMYKNQQQMINQSDKGKEGEDEEEED